ncbi:MAG: hypothetical protein CL917_02805 [Deltaproteobacteria bacterium]|nr:hypothetical protein [Deltaproteobacteria bacterium]
MILAAGLGTRLQPLTHLKAKPALPVLGRPVIAWLLEFLRASGIKEVAINVHYRPESIKEAVQRYGPGDMKIEYFTEKRPLGTGGGIAAARHFLSRSDPAIIIAGDMLLDVNLQPLIEEHLRQEALCTLLLQDDAEKAKTFGSIGLDAHGRVKRIAQRLNLGDETERGVFVGLRLVSPKAFSALPGFSPDEAFEDLTDWFGPLITSGDTRIRGHRLPPTSLAWTPVGTPEEYLHANLSPSSPSYLSKEQLLFPGTQQVGEAHDVILGPGATVGQGALLERCVVWENETVPPNFAATGGVFAHGRFYSCTEDKNSKSYKENPRDE